MKVNSKSKNPFRMIGSCVGMIFGLLGSYLSFALLFALAESGEFTPLALLLPLLLPVAGFLMGGEFTSSSESIHEAFGSTTRKERANATQRRTR